MSDLAQRFHEAYERLAPDFGYKTREATAVPWEEVPEQNKALMEAVVAEVMAPSQLLTLVQRILAVQVELETLRDEASRAGNGGAAREYAIAITASEDLIMRINRGKAKDAEVFVVGDFEALQLQLPDPDPEYP